MSDITYSYCIENLRYIHRIIGIDVLIKEALFIDHLSKKSKIEPSNAETINIEPIKIEIVKIEPNSVESVKEKNDNVESELEIDSNEIITNETNLVSESKNIVINSQKYVRTVLSDECKCECNTNNGQRCTLKKSKDSKYCNRHKVKMSKTL